MVTSSATGGSASAVTSDSVSTTGVSSGTPTTGTDGAAEAGGSGGAFGASSDSTSDAGGAGDTSTEAGLGGSTTSGSAVEGTPTEEALASLSAVRQEHAVVALAGEIYVIGGYVSNQVSDSVQAYDPQTDSWREATSLPVALNHPNAGVIENKIYIAGFYVNGMTTASDQVLEYDPETEAWTQIGIMPTDTKRAASCVAVDDGMLYVIGGAHDGTSVVDVSRYDPAEDRWDILPSLPEPREHCVAGAIGATVYVAGGRRDTITGIEPESWALDLDANVWQERAALPTPRGGLAGAVLHDRLFVFGGEGNQDSPEGVFANIDAYDPATDSWQAMPPMLVPRHGYGAATLDDRIYLAGGAIRQGGAASDDNSVFYFE